jgi:tyrosinase
MQLPPVDSYPIPKADVDQILAVDDYDTFRKAIEGFSKLDSQGQLTIPGVYMHNYIHGMVGGATFDPAIGRPDPLGTMASLNASLNDPVFWLHHANVDRLWAEWQSDGHAGSDYYPAKGGHYGENLNDRMWPWDGGESTPVNQGPGDLQSLLPHYAPDDIVTPEDTLDFRKYGYTYDSLNHMKDKSAL